MNALKEGLDPNTARRIIETLGNSGTPPEYGFQYFTEGLDGYLDVIKSEYLESYIKDGGSTFKLVVGTYGGGKTHFLYCLREKGWDLNYMASYIVLSPERTPFHDLSAVYADIANNLIYSQGPEKLLSGPDRGIQSVIEKWYFDKYQEFQEKKGAGDLTKELTEYAKNLDDYDSTSYTNALRWAFISLATNKEEDFRTLVQYLKGEDVSITVMRRFGVFEKIDKANAFKVIRSLARWIEDIGYTGIVVLLDEAEQSTSLTSKQKTMLYQNLRELIDECARVSFRSTIWFYAVPDENFLNGRTLIYEALKQRLSSVFDNDMNPTGVKILLESGDEQKSDIIQTLSNIGGKLASIYEVAYSIKFDEALLGKSIGATAEEAYAKKLEMGYKRTFVQSMIRQLHGLRKSMKESQKG